MLTVLKEQSNCKSLCCPVKEQNFASLMLREQLDVSTNPHALT